MDALVPAIDTLEAEAAAGKPTAEVVRAMADDRS